MNSPATPPLEKQVAAAVPAAVGPAELCVSHIFSIGKERPLFEKTGDLDLQGIVQLSLPV